MENYFSTWGSPLTLVTDNGPSFCSSEFSTFLKFYGVEHIRTPPYHPPSNSAAENMVKTFKDKLKKLVKSGISTQKSIHMFLMSYRSTPHCTTGYTPAELHLGRKMRTRWGLLRPSLRARVESQQCQQKLYAPGKRQVIYELDENVMAENVTGKDWVRAKIKKVVSPVVYLVRTIDGRLWK
uniref:Integrase catalytic domain-containing protein n=1 Tax=Bracon brevicornis TaxID=1563983 RepID=A0A6V7IMR0_9HYME